MGRQKAAGNHSTRWTGGVTQALAHDNWLAAARACADRLDSWARPPGENPFEKKLREPGLEGVSNRQAVYAKPTAFWLDQGVGIHSRWPSVSVSTHLCCP